MVLKKIDNRIRAVIEDTVSKRHRSLFLVVGERARDQVVILHHILSKSQLRARPNVLWCYKKELGFTSHRQKRMKQLRRKMRSGQLDPSESENPFEMFIATTDIRYCYYSETNRILGNTFGMCILQDFESLSPNVIARTIETVEGGGIVVVLLNGGIEQLKQLSVRVGANVDSKISFNDNSDDEQGKESASSRFNKRFLHSLADCKSCLVLDDQLNVLPLFGNPSAGKVDKIQAPIDVSGSSDPQLVELRNSLSGTQPAQAIAAQCCTLDQAKTALRMIDVLADVPVSNSTLGNVVSLTAGRGRGKSAALGLAVSAAVSLGYTNILVTSPAVDNVRTLFDFIQKGLNALNYEKHIDYDVTSGQTMLTTTSGTEGGTKAVVRITVHRERRRQNIVFIPPDDALKQVASPTQKFGVSAASGAFDLILIDEAAAVPLPKVRALVSGSSLTFLASTISGYEGTGRALSLKLVHQLRSFGSVNSSEGKTPVTLNKKRLFELSLSEPIRYGSDDPVEQWLIQFLCLDVNDMENDSGFPSKVTCPPPDSCELFYVNRDALFSYHRAAERFLHRVWSLYVAAHYKNSPNDMQLLADAATHGIFVLCAPVTASGSADLPEVLCVIQVCLEGKISKKAIMSNLSRGKRPAGDLVPWTMSQQFQDTNFASSLSGARVVRIATNPECSRMGYGSRAIRLLADYYGGKTYTGMEEDEAENPSESSSKMPPLLARLSERKPEDIDYLSVSYGLGLDGQLFKFWKKSGFIPLYLRQTASDVTGEHTCIMVKSLTAKADELAPAWLVAYAADFRRRLLSLLGLSFAQVFTPLLALDMIECVSSVISDADSDATSINCFLSPHDLRRLSAYASNQVDHHLISDLLPSLSYLYFLKKLDYSKAKVNRLQAAILVGLGLQRQTVDTVTTALSPPPPAEVLPVTQVLALLCRAVKKILGVIESELEHQVERSILTPSKSDVSKEDNGMPEIDEDNEKVAEDAGGDKSSFDNKALRQYAIRGTEEEWNEATANSSVASIRDGGVSGGKVAGFLTVKTTMDPIAKRKIEESNNKSSVNKKRKNKGASKRK